MKNRNSFFLVVSLFAIILILIMSCALILQENRRALFKSTEESMRRVLTTASKGLDLWLGEKKMIVSRLGQHDEVVALTQAFLKTDYHNSELLIQAELQTQARQYFQGYDDIFGNVGFFLIAPDGTSMASRRDNVGIPNPIFLNNPDRFRRVMNGETLFIPPFLSDIPDSPTTMFVLAPIRDGEERIIGALSQRLIPEEQFFKTLKLARISDSARTVAVDSLGRILVDRSQVVGGLDGLALNAPSPDDIINRPPLTLREVETEAGEVVFSMWFWDDSLEIGFVTQISKDKALAPYYQARAVILLILGVSIVLVVAVLLALATLTHQAGTSLRQARQELEIKIDRSNRDLDLANQKALDAKAARARFLMSLSREIRRPLDEVLDFSGLDLEAPLSPRERDQFDRVGDASRLISDLLNDVVDFALFEAGKATLRDRCFSMEALLEETIGAFQEPCREKGLALDLFREGAVNGCYRGDRDRLKQVLFFSLGNAVFGTERGGVMLKVSREEDLLHFGVTDTGSGMPPNRTSAFFDPFAFAHAVSSRGFDATGLGAFLCKKWVEAMCGTMWIESEPEFGTKLFFTIKLPATPCTPDCFSHTTKDGQ